MTKNTDVDPVYRLFLIKQRIAVVIAVAIVAAFVVVAFASVGPEHLSATPYDQRM